MERRNRRWEVLQGILLLFGFHILVWGLVWLVSYLFTFLLGISSLALVSSVLFVGIGLSQLFYVLPLCLWLQRRGRAELAKGVVIGAVITFLLNGSCFAFVLYSLNNY